MKNIKLYLMTLILMVFSSLSLASEPVVEKGQTLNGIKTELIENLKTDGLITSENAVIAIQKYTSDTDTSVIKEDAGWRSHVTLANALKLIAVVFLLFAGWGLIIKVIRACWIVIAAIPIIAYQAVALAATMIATLAPNLIWESQSFFVVLLGAILNLAILAWIVDSYPKVLEFVKKLFNLGIPAYCVGMFYLSLYLGALTVYQMSAIFATLTFVSLVAFTVSIAVAIAEKKKLNPRPEAFSFIVAGALALWTAVYVGLKVSNVLTAYVDLFNVSIQYFAIVGLAVIFQFYTTPYLGYKKYEITAIIGTVLLGLFGVVAYTVLGMQVAGTLIFCSFVILALQWIVFHSYKVGFILGSAVVGALIYASALLLEKYSSLLVFF